MLASSCFKITIDTGIDIQRNRSTIGTRAAFPLLDLDVSKVGYKFSLLAGKSAQLLYIVYKFIQVFNSLAPNGPVQSVPYAPFKFSRKHWLIAAIWLLQDTIDRTGIENPNVGL